MKRYAPHGKKTKTEGIPAVLSHKKEFTVIIELNPGSPALPTGPASLQEKPFLMGGAAHLKARLSGCCQEGSPGKGSCGEAALNPWQVSPLRPQAACPLRLLKPCFQSPS